MTQTGIPLKHPTIAQDERRAIDRAYVDMLSPKGIKREQGNKGDKWYRRYNQYNR
jgi:hypothetical protein